MEAPADSNDTDPPASKPKVEMKSKVRQKKNKKGAEQMAANAKKPGSGSNVSSKGKGLFLFCMLYNSSTSIMFYLMFMCITSCL